MPRLKLKRKANETLVVDGPAVITFARLGRHEIHVLIDAPKTTKILRGELMPVKATNSILESEKT
jgi:sRNA-binding carbon storage regulator CsrA